MVYASDPSGKMEIYIEPLTPGGAPRQISVEGGVAPQWRADGRELYYFSGRKLMAAEVTPGPELIFKTPRELFTEPALVTDDRDFQFQPSSDGGQFLMLLSVGGAPSAPPLTVVTNWRAALNK